MDLLQAYHLLNDDETALVFLGDGELRNEMEDYISKHNIKDVFLTGFKNQSEVGKYFTAADIFVLPSGTGETWGLVVNEAMNFNLPIIVSDIVGSYSDLVSENMNGYSFKAGDIIGLKNKLFELLNYQDLGAFGNYSKNIVENYSFKK